MHQRKLLKIIKPYCDKIVNGTHYKAYVKGTDKIIVFSKTPSDYKYYSQIYRDFRRIGIIIPDLIK